MKPLHGQREIDDKLFFSISNNLGILGNVVIANYTLCLIFGVTSGPHWRLFAHFHHKGFITNTIIQFQLSLNSIFEIIHSVQILLES